MKVNTDMTGRVAVITAIAEKIFDAVDTRRFRVLSETSPANAPSASVACPPSHCTAKTSCAAPRKFQAASISRV